MGMPPICDQGSIPCSKKVVRWEPRAGRHPGIRASRDVTSDCLKRAKHLMALSLASFSKTISKVAKNRQLPIEDILLVAKELFGFGRQFLPQIAA